LEQSEGRKKVSCRGRATHKSGGERDRTNDSENTSLPRIIKRKRKQIARGLSKNSANICRLGSGRSRIGERNDKLGDREERSATRGVSLD